MKAEVKNMRKGIGLITRLLLVLLSIEMGILFMGGTMRWAFAEQEKPIPWKEQPWMTVKGELSLVKATNFPFDPTKVLVIETAQGERFALYGRQAVELRDRIEELKDKHITVTGKRTHFKRRTHLGEELITVEVRYINKIEDAPISDRIEKPVEEEATKE